MVTTRPLLAAGLVAILVHGAATAQTAAGTHRPADESSAARAARFEAWRAAHRDLDPRAAEPGAALWECAMCPEMVVAPAGAFTMGSPEDEPGRGKDEGPSAGSPSALPSR